MENKKHNRYSRGPGALGPWGAPICFIIFLGTIWLIAGCRSTVGNSGSIGHYSVGVSEAQWVRDGQPILFEGEQWYPADGVESFLDSEMLFMGKHLGIPYFVDKVDVRPFERIYTKFDRNKFRFFEKGQADDPR